MIRQIETEINRFNDMLYIVQMLKDQSFLENHWIVNIFCINEFLIVFKQLINEVYSNKKRKPDFTSVSLSELLSANLLQFNSLIFKISLVFFIIS